MVTDTGEVLEVGIIVENIEDEFVDVMEEAMSGIACDMALEAGDSEDVVI